MCALVIAEPLSAQLTPARAGDTPLPSKFAQPEFQKVWSGSDAVVASGAVSRSWLWGPAPGAAFMEAFAQGVDGKRPVQYFDKARMELNAAVADPASPWRVSTGLLVTEMVQGRIQTGEKQFLPVTPSGEVVAGDSGVPGNPRYSDFTSLANHRTIDRTGEVARELLGTVPGTDPQPLESVHYVSYVKETGHNIPDVFWDYMNQTGVVADKDGRMIEGRLFDWTYLMGYPITEPYWAQIKVEGRKHLTLIQLFQRRTLTYVPDMPPAWRVQMGNAGQQYYTWRYGQKPPANQEWHFPSQGGFVGISGDDFVYAGAPVKLKGTNFWLHEKPFVMTWANWHGPNALAELAKAKDLGVNTIRVGLPFNDFITADLMWNDDPTMSKISTKFLDEMTQLLQIASIYGMKVIFVLFEWYDDYPKEGSPEERAILNYLNGIVGTFANDDRVLAWDLHNEPDNYPEWESGGQTKVIKWLERMASVVRGLDHRHPITVGVGNYEKLWSGASDGTTILSFVDIAAFHCYDAGALADQINEIKLHTRKPILLEEMGWPTSPGEKATPKGAVFDEPTQNYLYRTMLHEAVKADIAGVVQWTLWDYVPRSTTGMSQGSYEEHFGLVRVDGSFKPAAAIFRSDYSGRVMPSDTKTYRPLMPEGK